MYPPESITAVRCAALLFLSVGGELEQEAAQILSEDMEVLRKAEELWLKAMVGREVDSEVETGYAEEKGVRYSLSWKKPEMGVYWAVKDGIIRETDCERFYSMLADIKKSISMMPQNEKRRIYHRAGRLPAVHRRRLG